MGSKNLNAWNVYIDSAFLCKWEQSSEVLEAVQWSSMFSYISLCPSSLLHSLAYKAYKEIIFWKFWQTWEISIQLWEWAGMVVNIPVSVLLLHLLVKRSRKKIRLNRLNFLFLLRGVRRCWSREIRTLASCGLIAVV